MKTELIDFITDYLDYLRSTLKLKVSFCDLSGYYGAYMHVLYPYNAHANAFCECVKNTDAFSKCVEKQRVVLEKSKNGAFYGSCWAGMEEFVFPISQKEKVLGFVSVSGYRGKTENALSKIEKTAKDFRIDLNALKERYFSDTTTDVPNADFLATVIHPLCVMLEKLYAESAEKENVERNVTVYEKILKHICEFYYTDVSLESLASTLNYSKSYIRQVFKRYSKQSISEYLIDLRIKRAKELLTATGLSVNEVSNAVGYPDPNYFSTLFKKKTGYPPKQYKIRTLSVKHDESLLDFIGKRNG